MKTVEFNYLERLKEIDMFFDGSSPVHQTMQRLTQQLLDAGIPYAVMGGMAVNAHRVRRTTDDLDVLVTAEGLQKFRQLFLGEAYEQPAPKRTRRFVDRQNNVIIDFLVTGLYPGRGEPVAFAFPDPTEASEEINHIRVVTLVQLVQLKLAARRYQDFADVVHLIRVHDLAESFADRLHPSVRSDYIECLEEHRRDEEYKAREGIG
jgi:hypothetical protein